MVCTDSCSRRKQRSASTRCAPWTSFATRSAPSSARAHRLSCSRTAQSPSPAAGSPTEAGSRWNGRHVAAPSGETPHGSSVMTNPAALLPAVVGLAREAGLQIMQIYAGEVAVWRKGDDSPLTSADLAAHRLLMD